MDEAVNFVLASSVLCFTVLGVRWLWREVCKC